MTQDGLEAQHAFSPKNSDSDASIEGKMLHHENSGESAGTWFKNANEHVPPETYREPLSDEEPPFYLTSQEPYHQLPHSGAPSRVFGGVQALPADSEKEDLRDVIDDLTIENRKLKKRLRSHKSRTSRATGSHAEDTLFEVRVHGMRAEKKRELELLLKNFATSLEKDRVPSRSTGSLSSEHIASLSSQSNSGPSPNHVKPVHTDSGYGSNSNAGRSHNTMAVPSTSKDHAIKSYLHDIPDVLLPQHSYQLSDKAKMALVVQRLEQLFTGKTASSGDHQQPNQQQEVSKSAAHGDRQEDAARKRKRAPEGTREAHILPPDAQYNLDISEPPSPAKSLHSKIKSAKKGESPIEESGTDPSQCNSPDQRPTRPLDLDIGRAQVAQENLEYIRHLGLQVPALDQGGNGNSEWIYLNLLTSMAQLHTLNVTPDFVRRAIRKRSTRLELSKDERQVRWRGGADKTIFSKDTERAMEHTTTVPYDSAPGDLVGNKGSKTDSASHGRVSLTPSEGQTSREESSNAKDQQHSTLATSYSSKPQVSSSHVKTPSSFDYKPLFHKHKPLLRRQASSMDDSTSSAATDSTGLVEGMSRSKLSGQNEDGEGMLTFYNNAYFCSDLSADKHSAKSMQNDLSSLIDFRNGILGIPEPMDYEESALRHHDACYFAPQFAAKFTPPKNSRPIEFEVEPMLAAGEEETQPMEMEASGLGMIVLADNFAIDVKVARTPVVKQHLLRPKSRLQRSIPARFQYYVESAQYINLQASRLPSPLYLLLTSSSSSAPDAMDEDSEGSESSSSAAEEVSPAPLAFMRHFSNESSGDDFLQGNLQDDDSSMDMLRDARTHDPKRTAAQEHEYLLNHPGAAMTVSPSLAATIGTPSVQGSRPRESSMQEARSDTDEVGSYDSDDA